MQFSKLRLTGFKSFVEPTDFEIHPGLTGIIGPNGCGKSNLVEALRWVMGENSYKSMRASGMDDVIFAGGGSRPARNMAEVGLTLDNSARTAPASFNDADVLEVTRRIEREQGSTYRINGREVRARDVQILFADASTGSRSPALVRQGQIAEIIAAKPQARRRVLEEAAGVAGLHTRRHEAELRLRGAEENLSRIDDVLTQIAGQVEALRRQARQATRFRDVQAEIRRLQALAILIAWEDAERDVAAARSALTAAEGDVIERTRAQGEAARRQAVAAHALPALRERETEMSTALQNALVARQTLDGEERRAVGRRSDLERRIKEMSGDLARENVVIEDAGTVFMRLDKEEAALLAHEDPAAAETTLQARIAADQQRRLLAEATLAEAQTMRADALARRRALEERLREDDASLTRSKRALAQASAAHAHAAASLSAGDTLATAAERLSSATVALDAAESAARDADQALAATRGADSAGRAPLTDADRTLQRLETEVRTLVKLLEVDAASGWPPVTETIAVERGLEAALGAALGDDLDASADPRAPAHWAVVVGVDDPNLPVGATALSRYVEGPTALHRRLAQIGLVQRTEGAALRLQLAPGQRLVSREGDLWRWDGFTQAAESPTPAARRLVERNRLSDLRREAVSARARYEERKAAAAATHAALRDATAADATARAAVQNARRTLDTSRASHAAAERQRNETAAKLATLAAAEVTARAACDEAIGRARASADALAALPQADTEAGLIDTTRRDIDAIRASENEARLALQLLSRERDARSRRLAAIIAERSSWKTRAAQAAAHRDDVTERLSVAQRELAQLIDAPDRFILARRQILTTIETCETNLRTARDARVAGETMLAEADREARAALEAMTTAREVRVRSEAKAEGATQHQAGIARTAIVDLECQVTALPALAGVKAGEPRPAAAQIEGKIEALKADRDRIGAVNLRAEDELATIEAQRSGLDQEKDDLTEAIRRLRQAIGTLNKDGRERLLKAFDAVNSYFKELFNTLFGGGTAELQLIESDDPLEAGLEIVARPPGKKPQVMTLLSGGEQALTAISLIFAVFLTNPSPICVLDEVDAPLDDANVERFCDLVDVMRSKTQTRFITITHNPITMARMDRLYGVTQAERGISQLVSVDLAQAEQMLEAS